MNKKYWFILIFIFYLDIYTAENVNYFDPDIYIHGKKVNILNNKDKFISYKILKAPFPAIGIVGVDFYSKEFMPPFVGSYTIELRYGDFSELKNVTVASDIKETEEKLRTKIVNSYMKEGNSSTLELCAIYIKNFYFSLHISEVLNIFLNIIYSQKLYSEYENNFKILSLSFKIDNSKELRKMLYALKTEQDIDKSTLSFTYAADSFYKAEMLIKHFNANEGINLIKEKFSKIPQKEAAFILAEHYAKRGEVEKAASYYFFAKDRLAIRYSFINSKDKIQYKNFDYIIDKNKLSIELSKLNEEAKNNKRIADFLSQANYFSSLGKDDLALAYYVKLEAMHGLSDSLRREILYNLGRLYFMQNNYEKSLEFIGKYLKIADIKSSADSKYMAAVICYKKGKMIEAKDYFEQVIKDYPFTALSIKSNAHMANIKAKNS